MGILVYQQDGGAYQPDGGARADGGMRADGGAGADGGPSYRADGGARVDGGSAMGVWVDSSSGLTWQNPRPSFDGNWEAAKSYCQNSQWAGYNDWRLPTIGELRTLIRGCPATQSGGACPVNEAYDTWDNRCLGCSNLEGPGLQGCYQDRSVRDDNDPALFCRRNWSSSIDKEEDIGGGYITTYVYTVNFQNGRINGAVSTNNHDLRCIRP